MPFAYPVHRRGNDSTYFLFSMQAGVTGAAMSGVVAGEGRGRGGTGIPVSALYRI